MTYDAFVVEAGPVLGVGASARAGHEAGVRGRHGGGAADGGDGHRGEGEEAFDEHDVDRECALGG